MLLINDAKQLLRTASYMNKREKQLIKTEEEAQVHSFFFFCLLPSGPATLKCPHCSADVSELVTQCNQYRILCEERDKLLELVHILQTK